MINSGWHCCLWLLGTHKSKGIFFSVVWEPFPFSWEMIAEDAREFSCELPAWRQSGTFPCIQQCQGHSLRTQTSEHGLNFLAKCLPIPLCVYIKPLHVDKNSRCVILSEWAGRYTMEAVCPPPKQNRTSRHRKRIQLGMVKGVTQALTQWVPQQSLANPEPALVC